MIKAYRLWLLIGIIFTVSCGPSPEATATMTASAWTPTPEPTPTSTPIPTATPVLYDLEVTLEGENSESVYYDAYVRAKGFEKTKVDETGIIEMTGLTDSEVWVNVTAQGYLPTKETFTLVPGKNSQTITLTADPTRINPSTACDEGQKLLYIEDFEDEATQGWKPELNEPFWTMENVPGHGKVATYNGGPPAFESSITDKLDYGNIVWKFDFKGGDTHYFLHRADEQPFYRTVVFPEGVGIQIFHEKEGVHIWSAYREFSNEGWTSAAIAYFAGSVEVWINNQFFVRLIDPTPIKTGGIGLISHSSGVPFSIDNLVICELTEKYAGSGN